MRWNIEDGVFEDFEIFEVELTKDLTATYCSDVPKAGEKGLCGLSRLICGEWLYWILLENHTRYWICVDSSFKRV